MKNLLKFTTVVAVMLSTVVGMAKEPKMNLVANSVAKSLIFTLEEVTANASIYIVDEYNNVIYSEKVDGSSLKKKYDFENLNYGTYYFLTENDLKSYKYTLSLGSDTLEIVSEEETYKALFRKTDEKVFMNLLNLDKSRVDVKVYSAASRLIYSETFTDKVVVEKAFNFENAYAGNYFIEVLDGDKRYIEEFVVD